VELLGRGYAWLDTGTHESLLEAGEFIATIEKRQGLKMACIEEIAYKSGYIDKQKLLKAADSHRKNSYGDYLKMVAEQEVPDAL
jgi:glucose-1-phosphate thymidylyltransferase